MVNCQYTLGYAHRDSLQHLEDAVNLWNSMDMHFAVSTGDLMDGQNSGKYGQGNDNQIIDFYLCCYKLSLTARF